MRLHEHAERQCRQRDFDPADVLRVVNEKIGNDDVTDAAVFIGKTEDRGGLIGSNGSEVWAIVRNGEVKTVMLRRPDQPSTNAALRVSKVYKTWKEMSR